MVLKKLVKADAISLIAAFLIFASLFIYEQYFFLRIVALVAAIGVVIINLCKERITINTFYLFSGLILISTILAVLFEKNLYINDKLLLVPVFIFIVLLSTYRDIFKENNEERS